MIPTVLIALLGIGCMTARAEPGEEHAQERVEEFIRAVNENRPRGIYPLLTPELRGKISKEGFVRNFRKERSYPYLTPLYVYLEEIDLSDDKKEGEVSLVVAARLPGERMYIGVEYVGSRYYIEAFEEIVDGTFIEKFKRL